jgi:hypothetical protein
MRIMMLGLALAGAVTATGASSAQAGSPFVTERAAVQPVYWDGDYCGARCQEHRAWRRHERWETSREWRHHRRWEERHYGYYAYPRY